MLNKNTCPICSSKAKINEYNDDCYSIDCIKCGKFRITGDAVKSFEVNSTPPDARIISYWIRHNQLVKGVITIDLRTIKRVISTVILPKPFEQAENLINWIGTNVGKYDSFASIPLRLLLPIVGSVDEDGVKYVADYLKAQGYIVHQGFSYSVYEGKRNPPEDLLRAQMTFKGWAHYDELQKAPKNSRLAFMAMKFGDAVLDRIYTEVIKSAVIKTGFEIRKLDEEQRAGLIDDRLRVEIRRSKFVIADLSHDNNGAYWEAGYAEGLGLPVIYICEQEKFASKTSHFDTNHHLTICWKDDPKSLEVFAEQLKATIRATLPTDANMEDFE